MDIKEPKARYYVESNAPLGDGTDSQTRCHVFGTWDGAMSFIKKQRLLYALYSFRYWIESEAISVRPVNELANWFAANPPVSK